MPKKKIAPEPDATQAAATVPDDTATVAQAAPDGDAAPGGHGQFVANMTNDAAEPLATSTDTLIAQAEETVAAPLGVSSAVGGLTRNDTVRRSPDSLAQLTNELGAGVWTNNRTFPELRDPSTRHQFRFTRFYFREHVLVDIWPNGGKQTDREAEARRRAITDLNVKRAKESKPPFGYMPLVKGVSLTKEAFERVLKGEVLPLLQQQQRGVLV